MGSGKSVRMSSTLSFRHNNKLPRARARKPRVLLGESSSKKRFQEVEHSTILFLDSLDATFTGGVWCFTKIAPIFQPLGESPNHHHHPGNPIVCRISGRAF